MKYKSGYRVHNKTRWSATAVRRILQNEVYLGVMEQGKRTTPNYKVKTVVYRPPEEWMRVEDTHEAIIRREDFDLAARLMRTDTRTAPGKKAVHPFAGLLCCGACKGGMVRTIMAVSPIAPIPLPVRPTPSARPSWSRPCWRGLISISAP